MAEKTIHPASADTYSASLAYEAHGKCGTIRIVNGEDGTVTGSWYKAVCLEDGGSITAITCGNISTDDCDKLVSIEEYECNSYILADTITSFRVGEGTWALYPDCTHS